MTVKENSAFACWTSGTRPKMPRKSLGHNNGDALDVQQVCAGEDAGAGVFRQLMRCPGLFLSEN